MLYVPGHHIRAPVSFRLFCVMLNRRYVLDLDNAEYIAFENVGITANGSRAEGLGFGV